MLYQMCELRADLISIWYRTAPVTTASMTAPPTGHAEEFTLILQQDTTIDTIAKVLQIAMSPGNNQEDIEVILHVIYSVVAPAIDIS